MIPLQKGKSTSEFPILFPVSDFQNPFITHDLFQTSLQ